jgi:ATP-dependent helicase HrpB
MTKQTLPIDAFLPQVVSAVQAHSTLVVIAEPGAGKTTRVPVALMQGLMRDGGEGVWIVLQPRRWAARLTATRIAAENDFHLGSEVGYQIRFENRTSKSTRIVFMTEGLLVRRLLEDPELKGVAGVILDEFHERSLDLDLSLALLKEIQGGFRPDLKLVVMSATLDPAPLERYFPGVRVLSVPGRVFPVERKYLATENVVSAVRSVLPASGDVLVFLPGAFEIEKAVRELTQWIQNEGIRDFLVLPLYASLPEDRQREVFKETGKRKIICATNIAETSITLPGIKAVVDSGLQKVMRMDPALGFDRLETLRISKASADQRAGRAGRVSAGVALRLWSVGEQDQLRHFETPEIHRVNLGRAILTLSEFGIRDFMGFDWFEKPKASMLEFAKKELELLGFLDSAGITDSGRKALRLPLNPRIAAIVLEASNAGCPEFGARLGALLDTLGKEERIRDEERFIERLNRLTPPEMRVARQILGQDSVPELRFEKFSEYESILVKTGGSRICVSGRIPGRRKVRAREGVLPEASLILVALDQGDLVASSWVPLSKAALFAVSEKKRRVVFDEEALRVRAVQGIFFEDLELSPLTDVPVTDEEARKALGDYLLKDPEAYFSKDPVLSGFFKRIAFRNRQVAEDASATQIEIPWNEVVPLLVSGKTRISEIEPSEVMAMIEGILPREAWADLDRAAPEHVEVPSGSRIRIDYDSDPPRISVRLQEVFGWLETPRIANGKVGLLMELLSPGFRPIQLTRDLKSFWASAYFEVKKELKARYPKHAWPEDPLTAKAEAKGRRRS